MFRVLVILCMKKLKIILQHRLFYFSFLVIALVYFLFSNGYVKDSVYKDFDDEEFIVVNIKNDLKKQVFTLRGKEKVLGVYYDGGLSFSLGDLVRISGEKIELTNNTVPNTFNYKKYLYNQGIYNYINISEIELVCENRNVFYKLKNMAFERSKKLSKSYSYVNGLILGDNSSIEKEVKTSYQENGISHLFAISGLHVSIFILIINSFLKRFFKSENKRLVVVILFLFFYMFLTGYSMSILRSAIFTILLSLNKIFKVGVRTIYVLLFTLVIIIFINPMYLYNIGLLFSFVITFYLICFSSIIKGNFFRKLFITSFISFVVGYPIVVNNFYQVNFLSIIYNMFFVPFISYLVLPLVIVSFIFPFFDGVLYAFIVVLEKVSLFLNGFLFSKVIFCKMGVIFVIVYYVLITFVFLMLKKGKRKYLVLIFVFMFIHYFCPFVKESYYLVFDVGQGDSALVYSKGDVILIDTGGVVNYEGENNYSISRNKIIPYLKSMGIRKIDSLVLTHGDSDHMLEALYIVSNFKVDKVIFNKGEYNYLELQLIEVLDKKGIEYVSDEKFLSLGDNKLYFLDSGVYDNENDNSSVLYGVIDGYKFLFMGDASVKVEEDLLEVYDLSDIDILKIGHHGSKTSSSSLFIDSVNPKCSVISVGKNNRYKHPNGEVLDNLKSSKIYRTDLDGSILFKVRNGKLQVEMYPP